MKKLIKVLGILTFATVMFLNFSSLNNEFDDDGINLSALVTRAMAQQEACSHTGSFFDYDKWTVVYGSYCFDENSKLCGMEECCVSDLSGLSPCQDIICD